MTTEDSIRAALHRAAESHPVNGALRRSTLVRARVSRLGVVAGAAAVATSLVFAGVGAVDALTGSRPSIDPGSGTPQEVDDGASDAPLLLVTAEGWRVTRAHQQSALIGELAFADREREIVLTWRPADTHDDYVEDRLADDTGPTWDVTIAGHEAILVQYDGTTDFTALWLDGRRSLELRGVFETVEDYQAVAATLQGVDEETWLAALPESTVVPDERPAVVEEMLADVPVPQRLDLAALKSKPGIRDRYQLGAEVTGEIACAWIAQWLEANEAGNEGRAREAAEAMGTSRRWAILKEMQDEGGWSEVVWDYADAMASDGSVIGSSELTMGREMTIDESYEAALGCD